MKIGVIHLSDLHYRLNWHEDQGVVLSEFFTDLEKSIRNSDVDKLYLAFSGDIVQAGDKTELFTKFIEEFDSKLNALGITKSQRICVPGNHDVSTKIISDSLEAHQGIMSLELDETKFNNLLSRKSSAVLCDKFKEYLDFQEKFSDIGITRSSVSGAGWSIDDNLGIYCLNSALCSSGGLNNKEKGIFDKGRLCIDTRSLQEWNIKCKSKFKILIMHHPLDWLNEWSQKELTKILRQSFSLHLSGHMHDQDIFHSINNASSLISCSAPPLFTNKHADLGYSIATICTQKGVQSITYRQWTRHRSFVAGVNFSNTDTGIHYFPEVCETTSFNLTTPEAQKKNDVISHIFKQNLDEALQSFQSQPIIWIDPVIDANPESLSATSKENRKPLLLNLLIESPSSTKIFSPPQFGLTSLAHHMIYTSWKEHHKMWLYIDAREIKPQPKDVQNYCAKRIGKLNAEFSEIECIIVDSLVASSKLLPIITTKIGELFPGKPVILMLTLEESIISPILLGSTASDYQTFYLWSLPRKEIRTIVRKYNNECTIGEENILVSKIATDLENLNLHRTPLNCLTLLKVFEISFDESPVNRCEMLKQVLFVLFNLDNIPSYKTRPDLKDCEYALGYYCETMIRKDNYSFSREDFLTCMHGFCKKQLIELDTHVLFDILYQNNIIVQHSNQFCFRFSYWIHYFAAQRMHHSPEFSEFIFSNKGLSSYPEVIEFYTGIDRRREDALSILIKDLDFDCDKIESSYGAPNVGAVYKIAQWNPTEDTIQKMRDEVTESVKNSNLPDSIKDQYADRTYNPSRPYNQTIHKILEDYSMALLMKHTSAGARALRNSDYANVELKHQLFQAILRCFEQVANSILLISPLLANNGQAEFEGASFVLEGDFGADFQTKFNQILRFIPQNVIRWFVDDIFSQKMAPLIIQSFNIEENEIRKHLLALLLIKQKPRNWEKLIASYIKEKHKNSFYLLDTYDYLQVEYKYSHSSDATLKNIYELLSMTIARHNFSIKTPGQKALSKIMSQMQDFIPVRKRTEDDNL